MVHQDIVLVLGNELMLVEQEEVGILRLELYQSATARADRGHHLAAVLTLADGEVSSYPLKLTQSITVTTPSSLNPCGSS